MDRDGTYYLHFIYQILTFNKSLYQNTIVDRQLSQMIRRKHNKRKYQSVFKQRAKKNEDFAYLDTEVSPLMKQSNQSKSVSLPPTKVRK